MGVRVARAMLRPNVTRRSLSSCPPLEPGEVPARRAGGERREASDHLRFVLRTEGSEPTSREVEGWALNVSRGGLRAVVDEPIELGAVVDVGIGLNEPRPCRIVWVQEEPGGAIVGVEFLDVEGPATVPPPLPKSSPPKPG
jgi:hypothetical protein